MMRPVAVVLILFLLPALGRASDADAQRLFEQGRTAFAAGHYSRALERFRGAAAAGLDSAVLHYNTGATLYRLGRYEEARTAFESLLPVPDFAALARYNLGLIALKQHREEQARHHFLAVRSEAKDPKLRRLAALALARLQRSERARAHGLVSLAAGYDDNVSFAPEADLVGVSRRGDAFAELLAAARKPIARHLRLEGGVYARGYQDVDRFNQVSLRAGLARLDRWGAWHTSLGGSGAVVYLGGQRLESIGTLGLEGRRRFGERRLRLRYRLSRIDGADGYAYLSGWRHRLRADLRLPIEAGRIELGYRFEANDRADLRTASQFLSQSPLRHALYAEWLWRASADTELTAYAQWRRSRYRDPNVVQSGALTVSERRQDTELELSLRATRALTGRWQAFARYSFTDNDSNIASYRYRRSEAAFGVERDF